MNELRILLQEFLEQIWRHRKMGILTCWVGFVLGFAVIILIEDEYKATARVYVDTSSKLNQILETPLVSSGVDEELGIVRESILGSVALEEIAKQANLTTGFESQSELQYIVSYLRGSIQIFALGDSNSDAERNLYEIQFSHSDPAIAKLVVSTILESFVEETLRGRITESNQARRFVTSQLADYEARLIEAESKLAEFNRRNLDKLPGLQGGYFQRLQIETVALDQLERQYEIAQSRMEELERQVDGESPYTAAAVGDAISALRLRLQAAELRLDELLLSFTDNHPDVVATRLSIQKIRTDLESQLAMWETDRSTTGLETDNPVLQALLIAKNDLDAELASMNNDLVDRRKRVDELRGLIEEMPGVEAELVKLNRDYEVISAHHQSLLNSLETEMLSRNYLQSENVEFKIIDPPRVTSKPVSPNRPVLFGVLFVGSIALGMMTAFIFSQFKPVFNDSGMLASFSNYPVLPSVSQSQSEPITLELFKVALPLLLLALISVSLVVLESLTSGLRQIIGI